MKVKLNMNNKGLLGALCGNRWGGSAAIASMALSFVLSGSTARATGFTLGDAANYGVIFQGGGGNKLSVNNGPGIDGLADNGNIGIAGTGVLQLSGPLVIDGNVDFAGTAVANGVGGNVVVNGTISGNHANVQTDMNNLNALSASLGLEAGTSIALNSGGTVTASTGTLDASGNRVFTVSSINLPNGTLTINGDGSHNVVINISAAADGNIHPNNIVISGGLTSDQVLFNVFGGAGLTGGPTLDINSNGGALEGTFLDPNGQVSIVHSVLDGRLYGGDSHDEQIVSGAEINSPGTNSQTDLGAPDNSSTLMLLGVAFVGLSCLGRKFQFRPAA